MMSLNRGTLKLNTPKADIFEDVKQEFIRLKQINSVSTSKYDEKVYKMLHNFLSEYAGLIDKMDEKSIAELKRHLKSCFEVKSVVLSKFEYFSSPSPLKRNIVIFNHSQLKTLDDDLFSIREYRITN